MLLLVVLLLVLLVLLVLLLVLLVLLVLSFQAFSQKNILKDTIDNRKYRNEIGIDVQGVFAGNIGGSFMYKKRTGDKKLIAVTYSDNLRFSGTLAGSYYNTNVDAPIYYNITNDIKLLVTRPTDNHQQYARIGVGKERIYFYGRFGAYYGADIVGSFSYDTDKGTYWQSANTYADLPIRSTHFGVGIVPFAGIKYRITNRLSLSAECNYFLAYGFQRTKIGDKKSNQASNQEPYIYYAHSINHSFDPLRFITLNYHFKRYR